jgi:hypothetical protein
MLSRTIILKTTVSVPMQFLDENGYGIDHSVNSRVTTLRLTPVGSTTPSYTRLTTTSAQFTWTAQTTGEGTWLFKSDESLTAGDYKASIVYTDPADTPDTVILLGEATWTLRNPETGAL